jgi:hypothetical protein
MAAGGQDAVKAFAIPGWQHVKNAAARTIGVQLHLLPTTSDSR